MDNEKPLHRMFSLENVLTPISIEKYTYSIGYRVITYAYLYVFGVRLARWNMAGPA